MFQAFILGIVQGLGEFLPISSSAHLILVPWVFGWADQGLAFDIALHWGTLFAVVTYFRKDVLHLIKGFLKSLSKKTRNFQEDIYQKLSWYLIVATIPAGIFGMLLEHKVEGDFRNPLLIAFTLGIFGVLLYIMDQSGKKERNLGKITWKDALLIGLAQTIALVPGVSRSGATMVAGLALAFKREDAARFSFLMSIPITLAAGISKIPDIVHIKEVAPLVIGFITSAVFGFLAIKYLLQYISKRDFSVFAWYRIAIAVVVIVIYFYR